MYYYILRSTQCQLRLINSKSVNPHPNKEVLHYSAINRYPLTIKITTCISNTGRRPRPTASIINCQLLISGRPFSLRTLQLTAIWLSHLGDIIMLVKCYETGCITIGSFSGQSTWKLAISSRNCLASDGCNRWYKWYQYSSWDSTKAVST